MTSMRNTMSTLAKSMNDVKRSISQMNRDSTANDASDDDLFSDDANDAKKPKSNNGNVALKREPGNKPLGRQQK